MSNAISKETAKKRFDYLKKQDLTPFFSEELEEYYRQINGGYDFYEVNK